MNTLATKDCCLFAKLKSMFKGPKCVTFHSYAVSRAYGGSNTGLFLLCIIPFNPHSNSLLDDDSVRVMKSLAQSHTVWRLPNSKYLTIMQYHLVLMKY